jgi:hypothetical protein
MSLAMASTGAFALSTASLPADITLVMGGASAQDTNLENELKNNVCQVTGFDKYTYNNSTASFRAIFCTTKSSLGGDSTIGNKKLLVLKRSAGGSGYGVQPVLNGSAAENINFTAANCSGASTVAGYTYNCVNNATSSQTFNSGVSDVDPGMFVGANVPTAFVGQDITSIPTNVTVKSAVGVVFGLVANKEFRDELQKQTFGATNTCVGNDTEACMPSIRKAQANAIWNGTLIDWQQFSIDGVNNIVANANIAPTDTLIKLCRRENGSGTQATANSVFVNYPCAGNNSGNPVTTSGGGKMTDGSTDRVTENSSSGTLETCMTNADGYWKIGFQTTEKKGTVTGTNGYRFLKIDGYAPKLENVWAGTYPAWGEATFQWKNTDASVNSLMSFMVKNIGSPTVVSGNNTSFSHTFGQAGYLALPSNGYDASATFVTSNPVTPYQHNDGGILSNCKTPTWSDPGTLSFVPTRF